MQGRHDLPWLDHPLRKKINKKNRLHRRAKRAKPQTRQQRWEACHNLQGKIKEEIKISYYQYMNSLFEDENLGKPSKKFWKTIKAKRRDQVGVPPLMKKDGKLESSSKGKSQVLNAQYTSVFREEDISNIPDLGHSPYPSMSKISVTVNGVKNLLLKLNPKKALGPDLVPTHVLRDYADEIAPILQTIFQQSLDTGDVPDDWRKANVAAKYEKGDRHVASNYRPVSLTCVSCKILEHIVFRSIMDHVDLHKILVFFQHGFRAGHSCETQLINTIEDLAKGMNDEQQLDLLILDFSKAFDLLGHRRLLAKLQYYGIRNQTLNWISNWLIGRTQRVVVGGECSQDSQVKSGVPQGTVLGPLMFLLYINDIGAHTGSSIRLFADDCLLYRVIQDANDAQALQNDLAQMCSWATDWQMLFNADKCSVLTITHRQSPLKFDYTIGGKQLQHVTHHPYLGVELTSDLNWEYHINQTVSKSQRTLNLIRRNLYECSQNTKELAYKTLVRPSLEYASCVWDPFQTNHIHRLEAVQRKAARFVTGQDKWQTSVTALLNDLHWRSLQERRLVARLTMLYKTVHGQADCVIPPYFPHCGFPSSAPPHRPPHPKEPRTPVLPPHPTYRHLQK